MSIPSYGLHLKVEFLQTKPGDIPGLFYPKSLGQKYLATKPISQL